LEQDPQLVLPIMAYRIAQEAKALQNAKATDRFNQSHVDIMIAMSESLRDRQGAE
jgi:hypothetical protein